MKIYKAKCLVFILFSFIFMIKSSLCNALDTGVESATKNLNPTSYLQIYPLSVAYSTLKAGFEKGIGPHQAILIGASFGTSDYVGLRQARDYTEVGAFAQYKFYVNYEPHKLSGPWFGLGLGFKTGTFDQEYYYGNLQVYLVAKNLQAQVLTPSLMFGYGWLIRNKVLISPHLGYGYNFSLTGYQVALDDPYLLINPYKRKVVPLVGFTVGVAL